MCVLLGCVGAFCWVWRMFAEGLDFSIDTIFFCNSELVCRGWFDCSCVCSWQCGFCANVHLCSLYARKLMQVNVVYILDVLLQLFGRVGLDLVFLKANTACQRRSTGISRPMVVLTNMKVLMQNDSSKKQQKHISLASTDETVNNMYPVEGREIHGRDGPQ